MFLAILLVLQSPASATATVVSVGTAMDEWKTCTARFVRKYSLETKEPAETVVDAAIGDCSDKYFAVEKIMRAAEGGAFMTPDDISGVMKNLLSVWRPKLVAGVLRLRTK